MYLVVPAGTVVLVVSVDPPAASRYAFIATTDQRRRNGNTHTPCVPFEKHSSPTLNVQNTPVHILRKRVRDKGREAC